MVFGIGMLGVCCVGMGCIALPASTSWLHTIRKKAIFCKNCFCLCRHLVLFSGMGNKKLFQCMALKKIQ